MATTLNLPFERFVKRVTNGALLSKYSYLAMMAQNAEAIRTAPWRKAETPQNAISMPVNRVSETDAEYDESGAMVTPPTFTAFMSDAFDAFQQGGDARKEDATMCGYAGCVAYRFKIPTSAASVPLSKVSLLISRDRYCRAGVRVALALSDDAAPSEDWAVVRGTGTGAIVSPSSQSDADGVASWGFLGQPAVGNLVSGRAADGTIVFNHSDFAGIAQTGKAYLWVYLTLEDYQSFWTMYNGTDARYYSIEGSAMLVASRASFEFTSDVTADSETYSRAFNSPTSFIRGEMVHNHSGTAAAIIEAYGNFHQASCTSGILFTDNVSGGQQLAMAGMALLPSKPMFETEITGSPSELAGSMVHVSECNMLAGFKDYCIVNQSDPTLRVSNTSLNTLDVGFMLWQKDIVNGQPYTDTDGKARIRMVAAFKYAPFRVPYGRESYARLRMFRHSDPSSNLVSRTSGLECDLLLWKSNSAALVGTYAEAALAALASNPQFFIGGAKSVSGTITGDGTLTAGTSISADATLLQRIDMAYCTGTTLNVDLAASVQPGDFLIVAPTLKAAPTFPASDGNGVSSMSWDISLPEVQLV